MKQRKQIDKEMVYGCDFRLFKVLTINKRSFRCN